MFFFRIFSFPDLSKVHEFTTHEKEVDDIDFSPDSSKAASISKDRRALVWDIKKGKKHAELGWEPPSNIKYMFKRIKFGCVEGDIKKYKVYTISNPVGNSKAPAILHKWNSQSYTVENQVKSPGLTLSALAVSDNGNFVATGSMSEGIVEIFAAFNLSLLKRVKNAHTTFITGLEFLPTGEESAPARGFTDASVVSISVDHQVCVHHVPRLATIPSTWALFFIVLVLVCTFIFCSFIGL
ncbi:general transcriptional corepressor tupA [Eurytemora carolleeae]|uniref:general transcriptional corepressor tupA n=1 Tax=Eurytemora carolleeae TaxID=1294199 RepID=UPI000C767287|nr:general transcriptional corepressor tupA [Eurytemora carolleeae]|eukprot:XP_023346475.1 general transcriptional corepressor tupA-like [Eurytemora affinis]